MKITITAFGIAREIMQAKQRELEIPDGATITTLKQTLFKTFPEFEKLKSVSFALGENYQDDSYNLKENDEIIIIPPVSGG